MNLTVTTIAMDDFVAQRPGSSPVIDVREVTEYAEGHVPGAVLIPLGQVAQRAAEVPTADTVYVICRSGRRSLDGALALTRLGRNAVSVDEGTLGWIARGLPVVTGSSRL